MSNSSHNPIPSSPAQRELSHPQLSSSYRFLIRLLVLQTNQHHAGARLIRKRVVQ